MLNTLRLTSLSQIGQLVQIVTDLLKDGPVNVKVTKSESVRSQQNLYRLWLREMSKHFTARNYPLDPDDAHDLMRHKFLGYETKKIGATEITRLKSTKQGQISKGEMCHYMTLIDQWSAEKGCLLPKPEDSEYAEIMRQMGETV